MFKHQVGKAHQHALELLLRQRCAGHAGQQVRAACGVNRLRVHALGHQPKLHLGQGDIKRTERSLGAGQRGLHQRGQPSHQRLSLGAMACALATFAQALLQGGVVGQGKLFARQPLQLRVQKIARLGAARKAVPRAGCRGRLHRGPGVLGQVARKRRGDKRGRRCGQGQADGLARVWVFVRLPFVVGRAALVDGR